MGQLDDAVGRLTAQDRLKWAAEDFYFHAGSGWRVPLTVSEEFLPVINEFTSRLAPDAGFEVFAIKHPAGWASYHRRREFPAYVQPVEVAHSGIFERRRHKLEFREKPRAFDHWWSQVAESAPPCRIVQIEYEFAETGSTFDIVKQLDGVWVAAARHDQFRSTHTLEWQAGAWHGAAKFRDACARYLIDTDTA